MSELSEIMNTTPPVCKDCVHFHAPYNDAFIRNFDLGVLSSGAIPALNNPCYRTVKITQEARLNLVYGNMIGPCGTGRECRDCRADESDCGRDARFFQPLRKPKPESRVKAWLRRFFGKKL